MPSLRRASMSLPPAMFKYVRLTTRSVLMLCVTAFFFPVLFWFRYSFKDFSVPYSRPFSRPVAQFTVSGNSQCLPPVTPDMIEEVFVRHATCSQFSPFSTGRARAATVTAHFGPIKAHYQKALRTHLLHSLIHGTELRILCDPITDGLWNKPAFILDLLMREMIKPTKQRLEWIMWIDRDTLLLDQCRPISSFLPSEQSRYESWWRQDASNMHNHESKGVSNNRTEVNLLISNDFNGLNNGVFLLRVNQWAISLFTAILAFRHYEPDVYLPYTEQSAMEHLLWSEHYRPMTQFVPQHWFNAYAHGGPTWFANSNDTFDLKLYEARRGDFLVHFAGTPNKAETIGNYTSMLQTLPDVWKTGTVQRDVSSEVADFWSKLGY
jgi:mannan polymerase II complex MNN10 subunit